MHLIYLQNSTILTPLTNTKQYNIYLFLRSGLPSTPIRHENETWKRSSNRNFKTLAFRFYVDGKLNLRFQISQLRRSMAGAWVLKHVPPALALSDLILSFNNQFVTTASGSELTTLKGPEMQYPASDISMGKILDIFCLKLYINSDQKEWGSFIQIIFRNINIYNYSFLQSKTSQQSHYKL